MFVVYIVNIYIYIRNSFIRTQYESNNEVGWLADWMPVGFWLLLSWNPYTNAHTKCRRFRVEMACRINVKFLSHCDPISKHLHISLFSISLIWHIQRSLFQLQRIAITNCAIVTQMNVASQDWNDYSFSFNYVNHGFLMKSALSAPFSRLRIHSHNAPLPKQLAHFSAATFSFFPFFFLYTHLPCPHPLISLFPALFRIRIETIGCDEYKITNCSRMKEFRGILFIFFIAVVVVVVFVDHHKIFQTIFQFFVFPFVCAFIPYFFPTNNYKSGWWSKPNGCVCVFVLIFPLNCIWFIEDAQQKPKENLQPKKKKCRQ